MDAQKLVITSIYDKYGKITLQKLSELTGIQISRVFRILNGSNMKLDEYLRFQELVAKKNQGHPLNEYLSCYESYLSDEDKNTIYTQIRQIVRERILLSN